LAFFFFIAFWQWLACFYSSEQGFSKNCAQNCAPKMATITNGCSDHDGWAAVFLLPVWWIREIKKPGLRLRKKETKCMKKRRKKGGIHTLETSVSVETANHP